MDNVKYTDAKTLNAVWHMLRDFNGANPASDTDTFVKYVDSCSTENVQLSFTLLERLEQAKEEAIAVQDFEVAVDIRNLMDKFKKAGK